MVSLEWLRHIEMLLVLIFVVVALVRVNAECVDSGICLSCSPEMVANKRKECMATGRRMEMKCKDEVHYRSCDVRDDQLQVILFQLFVGAIGAASYWGVYSRKRMTMSLFDKRRKGYSTGNFLAI